MHTIDELIAIRVEELELTLKQLLQRNKLGTLAEMIDRTRNALVIERWAKEQGIEAEAAALQQLITQFRKAHGLFTAAQAKEWLEHRNMQLEDLAACLHPQVLRQALTDSVVSEGEVRHYFQEHMLDFERAEISRIVTGDYGQCQELLFRVEEGADFHAMARQYSLDTATAKSGGYAGIVTRDMLEPEEAAALFAADSGTVLGPFERRREFILLLVEKLYPAELDEETAEHIRQILFQHKLEAYQSTLTISEDIWNL
ncbi:peptidylprolyl isomerase [Paenibacillus hexagrammi]|uniref:peptidylprolyl isomerase n=1 Tax=Paenibacillus hexagrammi TaxID=2908839 RepID=A0ABY3SG53_9BACL|nr:peptidylprolyl isomerase [Paenibacillus sp. YPD9-1]UJF33014.1 peptidylprolyl isomerase [Paenibacillus sp. YPD9-1]